MKKFLPLIFLLFILLKGQAQNTATSLWTQAFGIQDTVLKIPTTFDLSDNILVAGSTIDSVTGANIVLNKYTGGGVPIWTVSYTSSGFHRDQATAIAVDSSNNIILGGFTYTNGTNNYDFLVLKYDSTGTLLWSYTYNGTGSAADIISAIALNGSDVYVTGASYGSLTGFDFTTIKLNHNGVVLWNSSYHYLGNDLPFDIDVSGSKAIVNGGSQSTLTDWDRAQLVYNIATGIPDDTARTSGTGVGFDHASQAVTDVQGYLYITGAYANLGTGFDYKTIKMDQLGNVKWVSSYDGGVAGDDMAESVGVDFYGNVYVTGKSMNSSFNLDYCTIKYDSLGNEVWVKRYNHGHDDIPHRLIVGDDNNVYITGESGNGSNMDFATLGYNDMGDVLWETRFNGAYNGDDIATGLEKNGGPVLVSGQSRINATTWQYFTIAYGEATYDEIPDAFSEQPGSTLYYPNNGQLANDTGGTISYINFYSQNQSPAMYFNNSNVSYVFSKIDDDSTTTDTLHRVDMNFMHPGITPPDEELYPVGKEKAYSQNFYLPHCSSGVIDLHGFNTLFVEMLYKGVDLYFTSNQAGAKHYFVISGNNMHNIVMRFTGADSISHSPGTYSIHTSAGTLQYDSLVAYEVDALGAVIPNTMQAVDIYADTANGHWHFYPLTYNTSNTLIIMAKQNAQMSGCSAIPGDLTQGNIFHSTFYGETTSGIGIEDNNDYTTGMTTDDEGNVYVTGFTNSVGFPTSTGAHQISLTGLKEGVLYCFDNNMVRKWATFMGGSNDDTLTCVTFNPNDNNIYFGGTTASSNLVCWNTLTNAYFDDSYNGGQDAIFASCQQDGTMNLITHVGGSSYDKAMGICVTGDQVMLTGNTKSTNISTNCTPPSNSSFPTCSTSGNFVKAANSGGQDIFLMKFENDNSLIWSTLIGSSADDKVYDIEPYPVFRGTGSYFYLSGETQKTSNTGPFDGSVLTNGDLPLNEVSSSTYFQSMAGGFVMEFDNLGNMVWGTTLNGTKDIQTLTFANTSIYLAGVSNASTVVNSCTESSSGVSVCYTSGEFNKNSGNLYFGRFNTVGELTYSTLYNAEVNIWSGYPFDHHLDKVIDMDANENGDVFILTVGVENPSFPSTNFETATPVWSGCYHQPNSIIGTYGDQYDCALLSFSKDNQRNWATFFGGGSYLSSGMGIDYPMFTEFPGAIACFEDKDLFIAGYSGKECSTFPLIDAGMTPTGQAYFYDDLPNSYQTTNVITAHADYDAFITKFDMAAVEVGVKERNSEKVFRNAVYPTITDNYINILLDANFSNSVSIELVNPSGNIISGSSVKLNGSIQSVRWDLSSLAKGIYLIRIYGEEGNSESFKIIKK